MSATVTLHVFSGRPNPTWILTEAQSTELLSKVESISQISNFKPVGLSGGLGYQGFSVQYHNSPMSLFVHAGIVDTGTLVPSLISQNREIEEWLLSTAGATVPQEARAHIEESVAVSAGNAQKLLGGAIVTSRCPTCHAANAPAYNPGMWNVPAVQPHNNCYNYANDRITNTFAQPGRAAGHMYTAFQCANVQAAATADGLAPTPSFVAPLSAGHGYYVALVIWPNTDFHWYRQDSIGCWSHKPGSTAVRNTDNGGNTISDPQTCNRGPYSSFCSYMITKSSVIIR